MTIYWLSYGALLVSVWYRKVKNRGRHSHGVPLTAVVELSPEVEDRFPAGAHRTERQEGIDLQRWHDEMVTDHRTGEHRMVGVLDVPPLAFLEDLGTPFFDELSPLLPGELDFETVTGVFERGWVDKVLAGAGR
jgi:hypothetical protein